jgi:threonine synthase
MVTLATAHPAKFPAAVEAATGIHPPLPPRMADLYDRPERITRSKGDLVAIQKIIKDRITS